jgi:hypothetical protein
VCFVDILAYSPICWAQCVETQAPMILPPPASIQEDAVEITIPGPTQEAAEEITIPDTTQNIPQDSVKGRQNPNEHQLFLEQPTIPPPIPRGFWRRLCCCLRPN